MSTGIAGIGMVGGGVGGISVLKNVGILIVLFLELGLEGSVVAAAFAVAGFPMYLLKHTGDL